MMSILILIGWICISILSFVALFIDIWPLGAALVAAALIYSLMLFKGITNKLQTAGRVYWIVRDYIPAGTPRLCKGFMREVDAPWRTGAGIQVRVARRTLQVGVCNKGLERDEIEGLAHAVGGRLLEDKPSSIGNW